MCFVMRGTVNTNIFLPYSGRFWEELKFYIYIWAAQICYLLNACCLLYGYNRCYLVENWIKIDFFLVLSLKPRPLTCYTGTLSLSYKSSSLFVFIIGRTSLGCPCWPETHSGYSPGKVINLCYPASATHVAGIACLNHQARLGKNTLL